MKRTDRIRMVMAYAAMGIAAPGLAFAQNAKPPASVEATVKGQQKAETAASNANNAPNAESGNFNLYNQTPWFANPGVREQLQLNDTQFDELNRAYQQSWNTYNKGLNELDSGLTPELRQKREWELYNGHRKSFTPVVDRVFANKAARARYNQLHTQYQSYGALADPTLQQELNLTDAQQSQIEDLNRNWNRQLRKWGPDYPTERDRIAHEFSEYRTTARARINSLLTPQQQQRWKELHGEPYDFTPDVYFGNNAKPDPKFRPLVK